MYGVCWNQWYFVGPAMSGIWGWLVLQPRFEAIMGALKALRGEAGTWSTREQDVFIKAHSLCHNVKGNGTKTHTQTHKHMGILWDSLVANLLEMPFCRGHDQLPLFSHKVEGVMTSKRSKQSALSFLQSLGKAFWLSFSEMQEMLITNEQIFQGA